MSPLGAARALITAGGGVVDQGKLELIETQTITSSTAQVDFTDLGTGYNLHLITVNNLHIATDSQDLNFRVFVGGSLQTGNDYSRAFNINRSNGSNDEDRDPTLDRLRVTPEIGASSNELTNGYFYLYNALSSSKYTFLNQHSTFLTKDPYYATTFGAGSFNETDTLSGFRFYMSSGNINEAEISLYGIAES
tara:strand:+ start:37 stop:612 length:576 start_codon:yes stop_codon:yes gene_type:complete